MGYFVVKEAQKMGIPYAIITDLQYTEKGQEGFRVLKECSGLADILILCTAARAFEIVAEGLMSWADLHKPI